MEVDTARLETGHMEAGVLKKLSLAGLAKLSRLRHSGLRLVWPQPAIVYSEFTIGQCTQPANSQLIPQSIPGISRLSLAERGYLIQFSD